MPIDVYDYRSDLRNVLVTPQLRARFLRMEPGEISQRHSHDLGHEVFLVLAGRARFEINGATAELEPGQLCSAKADEPHQIEVLGDEPLTLFLTVAPHIQPTHTQRDAGGERGGPRFLPSATYDVDDDDRVPVEELVDRLVVMSEDLSAITQTAAQEQRMAGARLNRALTARNMDTADRQREIIWFGLFRVFDKLYEVAKLWNRVAPRAGRAE